MKVGGWSVSVWLSLWCRATEDATLITFKESTSAMKATALDGEVVST